MRKSDCWTCDGSGRIVVGRGFLTSSGVVPIDEDCDCPECEGLGYISREGQYYSESRKEWVDFDRMHEAHIRNVLRLEKAQDKPDSELIEELEAYYADQYLSNPDRNERESSGNSVQQ